MTLLGKIEHFQTVWRLTIPHIPEPSPEDVAHWCVYPVESVEAGILRTVRRFSKDKLLPSFRPSEAYRYTSAVARSMTESARPPDLRKAPAPAWSP